MPSVSFRTGILAVITLLLLGIIGFRIWFLEVISGSEYVAMANNNRIRYIPDEAPRGIIYDRNHQSLVDNRAGLAVTVFPAALKNPQQELADLSKIIQEPEAKIQSTLQQHQEDAYSSVVVKKDITPEMKSYLIERIPLYFPGVDIKKLPLRNYPGGQEAAQLLGHVGQIDQHDLTEPHFKGYKAGSEVGKDGIEYEYDKWLRGVDGGTEIEVDATGRPKSDATGQPVELNSKVAIPGDDVVLSIDSHLQQVTEQALAQGIDLAHNLHYPATGGAAVVMNPNNGEILAMASYPTYDPSVWVGGMSNAQYSQLTDPEAHDPLLNRAIAGQYPPGSTFKSITTIAGLQDGLINPDETVNSTGVWHVPGDPGTIFHDWAPLGVVDLNRAIVMSCDTYFYEVGYHFYKANSQGIQQWARKMSLGSPTGVDIPGEAAGRIPDPAWKQGVGQTAIDKMWLPGNSVNMAIGQGDVLVTPLQMATVYSAIANGGRLVTPHIGLEVEDPVTHAVIKDLRPPQPPKDLGISADTIARLHRALIGAAQPGSAIGGVFGGFRPQIAGKSGTSQVAGKTDYAWYVAYAPAENPQYVVAVLVEQGGGGGAVAAPTVKKILSAIFPQAAPPPARRAQR